MTQAKATTDCAHPAGRFEPIVDRDRCEGKAECMVVCPVGVFEVGVLAAADRANLSIKGKLKGFVHGWRQAFAVRAEACEACGLCIKHCPESALTLVRRS